MRSGQDALGDNAPEAPVGAAPVAPGGAAPVAPAGTARVAPAGIAGQITAEGGRVTFARFMDLALTHPTDGYYSRAKTLLGPRGDFSTAPRLSPEFNETLERLLEELISAAVAARGSSAAATGSGGNAATGSGGNAAAKAVLVELGGGEGELAKAVLGRWRRERPDWRERVVYTFVEVGERLRARQRRALAPLIGAGWQVTWASRLEEGLVDASREAYVRGTGGGRSNRGRVGTGPAVVVGNEFVDALPVHLVDVRGARPMEAWVETDPPGAAGPGLVDAGAVGPGAAGAGAGVGPGEAGQGTGARGGSAGGLRESWGALSPEGEAELQTVCGTVETAALRRLSRDGFLELRPSAGALLGALAAGKGTRCLLTVDYGDWFGAGDGPGGRAARYRRTVRGYFRHQLVSDPYVRVGRQDLTADVDFRALALHGRRAGFETVLYTTVADMLRGDWAEEKLQVLRQRARTSLGADRRATVLEGLLDQEGLGGAFKVMLQVRE